MRACVRACVGGDKIQLCFDKRSHLENHIRDAMETMHFHIAHTKFLLWRTSLHILRVPLNNLA